MLFTEDTIWYKDTYSLKGKVQKKIYHANTKQRKPKQNPDVVVLTLDQVDFRMKNIIRDKVGFFFYPKRAYLSRRHTILNLYATNKRTSKLWSRTDRNK